MSLATRCTECGTVFRVVQDQLKVSEGWVRCGRCSAVFNALENLGDLETAAPGAADPADFEPRFDDPRTSARAVAEPAADFDVAPEPRFEDSPPGHPLDGRHEPGFGPDAQSEPAFVDPGQPEVADPGPAIADSPLPAVAEEGPAAIVNFSSHEPAATTAAAPPPQFVRAAEREAFWRRPAMRAGLWLFTLLLGVLLAVQLARAQRDLLAAHLPASRPALEALCQATACRIEPLRRIERLSVDSSGLARVEGAALYRLSVVLHNRAETALAAPALDLSLTDAAGKLVARRVLQPADLGLPAVLAAGQELPLQALLSAGDKRITGYTVELFYP
jgi:predicted Zn finger-like uncharacterized protein